MAEAAGLEDPADSQNPADPAGPEDPADPTDPVGPEDPADPQDHVESWCSREDNVHDIVSAYVGILDAPSAFAAVFAVLYPSNRAQA